jgi:hypothetical protein
MEKLRAGEKKSIEKGRPEDSPFLKDLLFLISGFT